MRCVDSRPLFVQNGMRTSKTGRCVLNANDHRAVEFDNNLLLTAHHPKFQSVHYQEMNCEQGQA